MAELGKIETNANGNLTYATRSLDDPGTHVLVGRYENFHTSCLMFIPDLPGPGVAPADWPENGSDSIVFWYNTVFGYSGPGITRWSVPIAP